MVFDVLELLPTRVDLRTELFNLLQFVPPFSQRDAKQHHKCNDKDDPTQLRAIAENSRHEANVVDCS